MRDEDVDERTDEEHFQNEKTILEELYKDDPVRLRAKLTRLRQRYNRVGW